MNLFSNISIPFFAVQDVMELTPSSSSLEKNCVVIGANTRLEIWDAAAWSKYLADREKTFADVSEEVLPGLF